MMLDPWSFSSCVSCNGGHIPCKFHLELQSLIPRYLQTILRSQQACWYLDGHLHQHPVHHHKLRDGYHRVFSLQMARRHEGRDH